MIDNYLIRIDIPIIGIVENGFISVVIWENCKSFITNVMNDYHFQVIEPNLTVTNFTNNLFISRLATRMANKVCNENVTPGQTDFFFFFI